MTKALGPQLAPWYRTQQFNITMPAAFFTLIRWKNLLLLAFTQYTAAEALREGLISYLSHETLWPMVGPLIASTVLIAAAGYLINDWYDVAIDRINKPGAPLALGTFPMRLVLPLYAGLNLLGIGIAAWVWASAGRPEYILVTSLSALLLWAYSARWKRVFMMGNVVVALLSALAVITMLMLVSAPGEWLLMGIHGSKEVIVFALFAFLLTWVREIVKDLEDREGDAAQGCRTMAIRWPLRANRLFAFGLLLFAGLLMLSILVTQSGRSPGFHDHGFHRRMPAAGALLAGLLWLMVVIRRMKGQTDFARASRYVKILMAAGIAALLWLSL